VHKISICVHIYKKMGKEIKRKKEKDFSVKQAGGDSGPSERACATTRPIGPSRPAKGRGSETAPWARAHMPARGEGNDVRGENDGPSTGRKNRPPVVRRRFSTGEPVLGGWGGGIARAG
jgi:hypothetical protein